MIKRLIVSAALYLVATSAYALDAWGIKLVAAGTDGGTPYIVVEPANMPSTCKWNLLYLSGSADFQKQALAVALVARTTGTAVGRIGYVQDSTSTLCTANLIAM